MKSNELNHEDLQSEAGRKRVFEALVREQKRSLYFFIRRMVLVHEDAHDVMQSTWMKAWNALSDFRGESKLSTWVFRIAYTESIRWIEVRRREQAVDERDWSHRMRAALQQDVMFSGDEIQAMLHAAVDALPARQKGVFVMRYFEGKPYQEMAEITGLTEGALKASYHHAVHKIEVMMKNKL
ncbi:MAG: RNA polymerase sigma factor [Flavobacteriales bacterium]